MVRPLQDYPTRLRVTTALPYLSGRAAARTVAGMAPWVRCLVIVATMAVPGFARADIFAFTDANGVTHFSNVPADSRFKLLIATPLEPGTQPAPAHAVNWLARSAQYD